jgi:chorismate lyase/3-hydroxybenzoate synthase
MPHYLTQFGLMRIEPQSMLGLVWFGHPSRSSPNVSCPHAEVAMPPADGEARAEVWTTDRAVQRGWNGDLQYAHDGESLFVLIRAAADDGFEPAVTHCYQTLLDTSRTLGYPHLHRIWNYFPRIHDLSGDLDRYRVFCRGRHEALARTFGQFDNLLPAASAVGTHDGDLVIYALASREPGVPRENPRQISAYHYPPQYGPRSPSFARATLSPARDRLYISGTASIVGHASQHEGNARAQLDETLINIEELIVSTNAAEGTAFPGLAGISHAKIYLRDPSYHDWVSRVLAGRLPRDCKTLYLGGEICRSELLLEIEAIAAVGRAVGRASARQRA